VAGGQPHVQHKVGGVPRGGQRAAPLAGLVQRAVVVLVRLEARDLQGVTGQQEVSRGAWVAERAVNVRHP
jgi:hypothetical protein